MQPTYGISVYKTNLTFDIYMYFPCEYQSIAGTSNLITEVNIRGNIVSIFYGFSIFSKFFFPNSGKVQSCAIL